MRRAGSSCTFDAIDCLGPLRQGKLDAGLVRPCCPVAFWIANREALHTPGQPLRVHALSHLRAHVAGRVPGIHAHVLTCELAPRRAPATPATQPETV